MWQHMPHIPPTKVPEINPPAVFSVSEDKSDFHEGNRYLFDFIGKKKDVPKRDTSHTQSKNLQKFGTVLWSGIVVFVST